MKKIIFLSTLYITLVFSNTVLAENSLSYNLTSDIKNGYVIDSTQTNKIGFSLSENENILFYNGSPIEIQHNRFEILIDGLTGKQEFIITNSSNDSVTYTYFISDKNGYIEDFVFGEMKESTNCKTYIKTINNTSIIYTSKDKNLFQKVEKILLELPQNLLANLKEIKLLPIESESGAAGTTKYNSVTLYNLSRYSTQTIENILIHEITHTWAHSLIKNDILDSSYSEYKNIVNLDKKFPSNYAKKNVKIGNYAEDFAESISFFFINPKSFEKNYPARTRYIKTIIQK